MPISYECEACFGRGPTPEEIEHNPIMLAHPDAPSRRISLPDPEGRGPAPGLFQPPESD